MCKHTTARGGLGAWSPGIFCEFRGYEICFWDHFWANTMLLRGQTTEFHMYEYLPLLPIALYSTGFSFLIVCLSCKPHPSKVRLARLTICEAMDSNLQTPSNLIARIWWSYRRAWRQGLYRYPHLIGTHANTSFQLDQNPVQQYCM